MRDRLTVGHLVLAQAVGVQVLLPQLNKNNKLATLKFLGGFFISVRKIYSKRLAIIEPVFANIRARKRLDRFTLRTKTKVNVQWMLFALVHNIEKIVNYGMAY
jgi:hypothetical protein